MKLVESVVDSGVGTVLPAKRSAVGTDWPFWGASALLFIVCAVLTIYWQGSMPADNTADNMADSMSMPAEISTSGDTMQAMGKTSSWESWLVAGGAFEGMWIVMMVAMMLPSLAPTLSAYRQHAREQGQTRLELRTGLAFAGYFFVWAIFGLAAYAIGAAIGNLISATEAQTGVVARLIPIGTGLVLLLGGLYQFSALKSRELDCCRDTATRFKSLPSSNRGAWQYGTWLGVHCCLCSAGYMVVLLATGMMDLTLMAGVAVLITLERLAPKPMLIARLVGVASLVAGAVAIGRALLLG